MIASGYEELVIGDFYDAFSEALAGLPKVEKDKSKIEAHLLGLLGNNEGANYLIMFIRWLTALFLKQNAILYEVWVNGDIDGFGTREVEQLDIEADHLQIIALTNYLKMGVEISSVSANGQISTILLPEEGYSGWRPKLLYVPGHYDALFE